MSDLSEVVFSLEKKVKALVKLHQETKTGTHRLEERMAMLTSENEALKEALVASEEKNDTLKTTNALLGSNDFKRETKLKINTLVREIDACIASLAE